MKQSERVSPRSTEQTVLKGYKIFFFQRFTAAKLQSKTGRIRHFSAMFSFQKETSHFIRYGQTEISISGVFFKNSFITEAQRAVFRL